MKAVRATITGRVQGVGYRNWCLNAAIADNITGWVRNCEDGSVEVFAQGENLETFVENLRKGPRLANVFAVESVPAEVDPSLNQFTIERQS